MDTSFNTWNIFEKLFLFIAGIFCEKVFNLMNIIFWFLVQDNQYSVVSQKKNLLPNKLVGVSAFMMDCWDCKSIFIRFSLNSPWQFKFKNSILFVSSAHKFSLRYVYDTKRFFLPFILWIQVLVLLVLIMLWPKVTVWMFSKKEIFIYSYNNWARLSVIQFYSSGIGDLINDLVNKMQFNQIQCFYVCKV